MKDEPRSDGSAAPNREFDWCSRMVAGECRTVFKKDHHHIAIRTPDSMPVHIGCCGTTLRLDFHDLGESAPKRFWDGLFKVPQAREIIRFVNAQEGLFVVNCEAGISRSAGVVLALRRFFGGDTEEVYKKAMPNIFVTSILFRALISQRDVRKRPE